jgi:hypothetical protein
LLVFVAVLLGGACRYGCADKPGGPPDIFLTCQRDRLISGDGRDFSSWLEDPFSLEICTKEGVISWREDYNARARISQSGVTKRAVRGSILPPR